MDTEDLIGRLSAEAGTVHLCDAQRVVAIHLAIGTFAALLLWSVSEGIHFSLPESDAIVFSALGIALAVAGWAALVPSFRPECPAWQMSSPLSAGLMLVAVGTLASFGFARANFNPEALFTCLPAMVLVASPAFIALTLAAQKGAPTRQRWTGTAIGMAAGGISLFLHSLGCTTERAQSDFSCLMAGVMFVTLGGFLAGPRLLKW